MNLSRAELAELMRRAPKGTLVRAAPDPRVTVLEFDVQRPVKSVQHQNGPKAWISYKRTRRAATRAAGDVAMLTWGWAHPATTAKRITLTAFVRSLHDDDGLKSATKPYRDGCKDAGLVDDDSPRQPHRWVYVQVLDRQRVGVRVRVELLPSLADSIGPRDPAPRFGFVPFGPRAFGTVGTEDR